MLELNSATNTLEVILLVIIIVAEAAILFFGTRVSKIISKNFRIVITFLVFSSSLFVGAYVFHYINLYTGKLILYESILMLAGFVLMFLAVFKLKNYLEVK